MKEKIISLTKKWWFWTIVVILIIGIAGSSNTNTSNKEVAGDKEEYTIVGEELGDFGKKIVLNKDSDMPVEKYLYKLPAGTYTVSTTFTKMAVFYIVKDEVKESGDKKYPEELEYVGETYRLTAGDDDFNGTASKTVEIKINKDESILVIGNLAFTFKKVKDNK